MPDRLSASLQSSAVRLARRALPVVAAALAIMICAGAPGRAQETVRARPGVETVIKRDRAVLGFKEGPGRGTVRIDAVTEGGERVNRLLYTPNQGTEAFRDELTYILNGADTRVAIEVEAGLAPGLTPGTPAYEAGFKALFALFVLAVILESSLGLLFDWRPFVENLNARSVKPLVSLAVAFVLVRSFKLDLVRDFVNAIRPGGVEASSVGPFLTAMVLGGGSAGVHNLLVALGYRQRRTPETAVRRPPPDKAWISVRVVRARAVGRIDVFVDAVPPSPAPVTDLPAAGAPSSLVGVIQPRGRPLRDYFLTSRDRFPSYGGHAVDANALVAVKVSGLEADGVDTRPIEHAVPPFRAAGGAYIDLVVHL